MVNEQGRIAWRRHRGSPNSVRVRQPLRPPVARGVRLVVDVADLMIKDLFCAEASVDSRTVPYVSKDETDDTTWKKTTHEENHKMHRKQSDLFCALLLYQGNQNHGYPWLRGALKEADTNA